MTEFRRDPTLEALLATKATDAAAWARVPAVLKMSAGYYAAAKATAEHDAAPPAPAV